MKTGRRASISISRETKGFLDSIKRLGQSYDGVIQELVVSWKRSKSQGEKR